SPAFKEQAKSIQALVVFISDLLDLEKVDSGSLFLSIDKTSISELIERIIANNITAAFGDPARIEFSTENPNLIVKGTPDGLELAISRIVMACLADTPGPVRVRVVDLSKQSKAIVSVEPQMATASRFAANDVFNRFAAEDNRTVFNAHRHSLSLARKLLRL